MRKMKRMISFLCAVVMLFGGTFIVSAAEENTVLLTTDLGGLRGKIEVTGAVPYFCYAKLSGISQNGKTIKQATLELKNGVGYYNWYGTENLSAIEISVMRDNEVVTNTVTQPVTPVVLPQIAITEVCNRNCIFMPNSEGQNLGEDDSGMYWQYIEICNYSDTAVDLRGVKVDLNDEVYDMVFESDAAATLEAGEVSVVCIFNTHIFGKGYSYGTAAKTQAYFDGFNDYFGTNLTHENRILLPMVSGSDGTPLIRRAEMKYNYEITFIQGTTELCHVAHNEDYHAASVAKQYSPNFAGGIEEEFVEISGCFPGKLTKEQTLTHCGEVSFETEEPINVISYNILAIDEGTHTVANRQPLLLKTIEKYQPDVMGLQEVNRRWIPWLQQNMPQNYTCVEGISTWGNTYANNTSGDWDLMNPIYFRNDKYTLLESGYAFLTPDGKMATKQWDSNNMKRTMTWAVLKNKQNGEVVSAINTHLVISGYTARIEQVKLLCAKGNELKEKYGGGVVIMGDNNMQEGSAPYRVYYEKGFADSKYLTDDRSCIGTGPDFREGIAEQQVPIDFCMVSPDYFGVERYHVIDDRYDGEWLSDHLGVFARVFNKNAVDDDVPQINGAQDGGAYCGGKLSISVTDKYLSEVTLNGKTVANPAAIELVGDQNTPAYYTLTAKDKAGRTLSATFSLALHYIDTWTLVQKPTPYEDGKRIAVCTACGKTITETLSATGVASVDNVAYNSLEQALAAAKAGQTIRLHADIQMDWLCLDQTVTLDLNGQTLTSNYVVGLKGSALIDSSAENAGKLVVDKDSLALDKANGGFLPIYDAQKRCYLFTNVVLRQTFVAEKYMFSPVFENFVHSALAAPEESGIRVVVRVSWNNDSYAAVQNFKYNHNFVREVIESYGTYKGKPVDDYGKAFAAALSRTDVGLKDMSVCAAVISDSGVEIESEKLPLVQQ